jgi:LemA protein
MDTLIIILAVVFVVLLYIVTVYNGLVTLRNRVREAWSDIDVQLKRRYDLIPNLVETVKGYASHEKETFDRVIQARSKAMSAQGLKERGEAENALTGTLKSLFALSESYPDLKASVNFLELQKELTDTEDKVQASRRFYNGNVMDFNTRLEVFPSNLIAQMFGFKVSEFFAVEEGEKAAPKVSF